MHFVKLTILIILTFLPGFLQAQDQNPLIKKFKNDRQQFMATIDANGERVTLGSRNQSCVFELTQSDTHPTERAIHFEDYNFDGYMDVSVSVPDDGYGVYSIYDVFIYAPATESFSRLNMPNGKKANCSCFCDLDVNKRDRTIASKCRGGAKWYVDVWKVTKAGKLVLIKQRIYE